MNRAEHRSGNKIIWSWPAAILVCATVSTARGRSTVPAWLLQSAKAESVAGAVGNDSNEITPNKNQILRLTESGPRPQLLTITERGSSVFFYNDTADSLLTVGIDFAGRKTYCSTGKMLMGEDGVVRSIEPFSPRGFASVCFPEPGDYQVTVYGLKANPKGLQSTIHVEYPAAASTKKQEAQG
ncbi:MAG: hypothetical protein KDD44_13905 [Bdellovibrionales bacterium]|nr:hypothetical protein [Bdellovibrionales bacterium]